MTQSPKHCNTALEFAKPLWDAYLAKREKAFKVPGSPFLTIAYIGVIFYKKRKNVPTRSKQTHLFWGWPTFVCTSKRSVKNAERT